MLESPPTIRLFSRRIARRAVLTKDYSMSTPDKPVDKASSDRSGNTAQPTGGQCPFGGSTLSTGAPAPSDRHSLSVGPDGPIVLHDVHFLEQMAHFNREKVPERQPHAKGSGAFGVFQTTADVSAYTRAALFQKGTTTDVLARFSTVAGEQGSPDTWRDVRGFSLKFYTDEGNYDLVGNNTPVFFVRDPMKFPHFIRSQKRLPDSGLRDNQMQWDFWTLNPESAHQVTYLMGERGLPRTWRHMNGYGSHTYQWINAKGEQFWVKYHFHTQQGMEFMTSAEAAEMAGQDADYHRRDLFQSIGRGDHPSWTLSVQIMPYADAITYRINPFDLTKTWPHADWPLHPVGTLTLNRNPENFFAQIEQAAFSPGNTVPGIGLSPDKMLLGRAFAYNDAQRHRIGTNFHQLPVNRPKCPVNSYQFDGAMAYQHSGNAPVYAPNSGNRPWADDTGRANDGWTADGELVRSAYTLRADDDDFSQAGTLVRDVFGDDQRAKLVQQVVSSLKGHVQGDVLQRALQYWKNIDPTVGQQIESNLRGEC